MPYKDKEAARVAAAERQRKHRNVTPAESVTPKPVLSHPDVTPAQARKYPALVIALCDPVKRNRLERINAELQRKGLGSGVTLGWYGPDFNIIDSCLKATS